MKKIFAILTFCLLLFVCIGCEETTSPVDVSGVVFEDATYQYQEDTFYSIEVENLPEGVSVTYLGNGVNEVGEHVVTAIIRDSSGNEIKRLQATIKVEEGGSSTTPTPGPNPDTEFIVTGDYYIAFGDDKYNLDVFGEATVVNPETGETMTQYHAVISSVTANDMVVVYKADGTAITSIGDERSMDAPNSNNVLGYNDNLKVYATANNVEVYLKSYSTGGFSIWVTGNSESVPHIDANSGGNQGGGNNNPQSNVKYQIIINGSTVVDLIYEGKWDMDPSYEQHHAFGVVLNAGDTIKFKDLSTGTIWELKTIDSASTGGMKYVNGVGIQVGVSGTYDIYVKTKFNADNVYFGPAGNH